MLLNARLLPRFVTATCAVTCLLLPLAGCQSTMSNPNPSSANSPANATMPLAATYWKLQELTGQPPLVQPNTREAFLQLLPEENRVDASGGCNRIMGKFALDGAMLTIGSVAMTKMACTAPGLMQQEQSFANALQATTGYHISGDMLELLGSGAVLARLQMQTAPAKP